MQDAKQNLEEQLETQTTLRKGRTRRSAHDCFSYAYPRNYASVYALPPQRLLAPAGPSTRPHAPAYIRVRTRIHPRAPAYARMHTHAREN